MKKLFFFSLLATLVTAVSIMSCTQSQGKSPENIQITKDSLIKRGNYLVSSLGCDDCHSPKKPGTFDIDWDRRLSGFPADAKQGKANLSVFKEGYILMDMSMTSAVGPWGKSFAANLTSDSTGIGGWTEQQFFRAIRKGLSKGIEGNRPLFPPMPWFVYKNLNDDDLRAIFTFLKSTKPVRNLVPQPKPLAEL